MLALVIALSSALAQDPAPAPPDWGSALRTDAQAIHDTLLDSHPGPHDTLNPGFNATLNDGLEMALQRAETATTVEGYWWALREYVASFNDGHTALNAKPTLPAMPAKWPGFITVYDNGRHRVGANTEPTDPPVGSELVSCDGIPADRLAAENIGRFRGGWDLQTRRIQFSDQLFIQTASPYLHRPQRCVFETEGRAQTYDLTWSDHDEPSRARVLDVRIRATARGLDPIGVRRFGASGYWITASDFPSDPATENGQANTRLIAELNATANDLRNADRIVLDLRGNNGGSSHWSLEMARALWGEDYIAALELDSSYVEHRVSDANIAHYEEVRDRFEPGSEIHEWAKGIVSGMKEARARGEMLWRKPSDPDDAGRTTGTVSPVRGRVYVLTDYNCGSACLDAADVWLAAGGVHVGQETFADSQYMDVRFMDLPSGYGQIWIPTKVYRDRPRPPNQPLRPAHLYTGAMTDTAALERWIETLP